MKKLILHTERCKSCGFCIRACPRQALALSGTLNSSGYDFVAVNESLCICCGTCYTVCPDIVFEITEGGEAK